MTTGITKINHCSVKSNAKDLKLTADQDLLDYSVKHSPADLKLEANQLTAKQEQIQKRLRNILDELKESFPTYGAYFFEKKFKETDETNIEHLKKFLNAEDNEAIRSKNFKEDLKIVLDFPREDGTTMLHDVADFYPKVTELLLDAGADPNIQDEKGKTPLHCAAEFDCPENVKILLNAGADPDIPNKDGKTPLQIAIDYRRLSAVDLFFDDKLKRLPDKQKALNEELLNLLYEINYTSTREKHNLKHSVDSDSITDLKNFLDYHKKENSEDLKVVLNLQREELGSTVLHNIHSPFYTKTFNLLLEAGADLNIQDIEGNTPLHIATRHSYQDSVKLLLGKEANPNIEDKDGNTPFRLAILTEHTDIVKLFLENDKTDVNLQDEKTGDSLIFDAVTTRASGGMITDSIIKSGKVDLSKKNKKGMTALHQAACYGKNDTVNSLLKQGIKASDKDHEGRDPLHFAGLNMWRPVNANDDQSREDGPDYSTIEKPDENVIAIINTLIKHNIQDLRTQFQKKSEQLHQEANEEYRIKTLGEREGVFSELVTKKKKYVNIKDKNGNTPLFYAIESGKPDVITKFLEEDAEIVVTDKNGYTPFHYAIKSKSPKILELLLLSPSERGGIVNYIVSALMQNTSQRFSNMNNLFKQDMCLDMAIYITEKVIPSISCKDNNEGFIGKKIDNMFPAHMKEDKESYGVIRDHISKTIASVVKTTNARLCVRDEEGNTLLHHAIKWGCGEEILDLLIRNGVDINAKNKNGVAPIHIAAKYGKLSQMEFFIKNKADLNVRCGRFTKAETDLENHVVTVTENDGYSSVVTEVNNDTDYEDATPRGLAACSLKTETEHELSLQEAEVGITNSMGAPLLLIVAARIIKKDYEKHERVEVYEMFRKLIDFSGNDLLWCKNFIEIFNGDEEEKEELKKILGSEPTAPIDEEASAPAFDENFYGKINVQEIPDLCPDLPYEIKKPAVGNYRVDEWDPQSDHIKSQHQWRVTPEEIEHGWGKEVDSEDVNSGASVWSNVPQKVITSWLDKQVSDIAKLDTVAIGILNNDYEECKMSDLYSRFRKLALNSSANDLLSCKELLEKLGISTQKAKELKKIEELNKILSDIAKLDTVAIGILNNDYEECKMSDLYSRFRKLALNSSANDLLSCKELLKKLGISTQKAEELKKIEELNKILDKVSQDRENGKKCTGQVDIEVSTKQKAEPATEISSEKQPISTENDGSGNLNTQGVERKEESAEPRTKLENLSTRVIQSNVSELNDNSALVKLAKDQQVKQDKFLGMVSEAQNIIELNTIVSEALKSGVRLNFSDGKEHNFTDYVIEKIYELDDIKKDPEITSNIICKLVAKGAIFNENYKKINEELENSKNFTDHKINVRKANEEFKKRFDGFKKIAKSAIIQGELKGLKMDNTTVSLAYSEDSVVDIAKVADGAKGFGLNQVDIAFGGNIVIVKIDKNAVEFEIKEDGKRNYTGVSTDISDDGAVIITFQTSLGELEVRLRSDPKNKDRTIVELNNASRKIFDQLKDEEKKEIGKNCLFGGDSLFDAAKRGYFLKSGSSKLQSSETQGTKDTVETFWQNKVVEKQAMITDSLDTREVSR